MKNVIKQITAAALLFAFILGGPVSSFSQPKNGSGTLAASALGNVDAINARQLKDWLTFIASDELEGRDTPSRGLDIAAKYLAGHLASLGIKPAGDSSSYFQRFRLRWKRSSDGTSVLKRTARVLNTERTFSVR